MDNIQTILTETGIMPKSLKLEITESLLMQNREESLAQLDALSNSGIKLSIDDFGTGFSSLSYIREFPFNILKIDKSFIQDIASSPKKLEIVIIIGLAKKLNLTTIAEGVETREQFKILKELQCDMVQGNLFSEPIPAHEFTLLLQHEN